jgi:HlyD family secretion protein
MKKWIIILIIVVILGVGGYFLFQRAKAQRVQATLNSLQTVEAVRDELVAMIGGTGSVHTNQTGTIQWESSGIVETVDAIEGDLVEPSDVLASLKQSSLPQNVILAKADLANAQKALDELKTTQLALVKADSAVVKAEDAVKKAQDRVNSLGEPASDSDIDVAKATVQLAKIQMDKAWDRYKDFENRPEDNPIRAALFNRYAQAKQQYDQAVSRLNNLRGTPSDLTEKLAQSDLDLALANLDDARENYTDLSNGPDARDVAALEARIAAAQATLDSAHLTAPFPGTITDISIKPGDRVAPGSIAFRLDDFSRLLVDVPVSEVDIARIDEGQDVVLTFDAISGQEYHGKVVDVDRVGTTNQGVVDFNVTVELLDATELVKPGMTAAVNIIVERLQDVLLVPNRAVRVKDGQRVVYLLKNGVPESVAITLGSSSETDSEVVEGEMNAGDLIVLNPPENFEFGQEPAFVRQMRGNQ